MQPVAQSLGFLRSCTDGKAGGAALSPRERMHVVAAQELAAGEWRRATAAWEAATRAAPTDIVALRLLQDAYLFLGDLHNLRDSVARAFQAWDPTMPNYGRLCGLLAFGYVALRTGRCRRLCWQCEPAGDPTGGAHTLDATHMPPATCHRWRVARAD